MGQQGGLMGMMLPLAMFAAIFYFLIIRPQKKKQKAHDEMLASITRGSTVVTAGGFFGIVREILDDSYIIEIDENTKARILKSSISMKRSDGSEGKSKKDKKAKKQLQEASETTEALDQVQADEPVQEQPESVAPEAAEPENVSSSLVEEKNGEQA